MTVTYSNDESRIRTMLSDLQNNVTSAILLVMVIIIAALGLCSAGLSASPFRGRSCSVFWSCPILV